MRQQRSGAAQLGMVHVSSTACQQHGMSTARHVSSTACQQHDECCGFWGGRGAGGQCRNQESSRAFCSTALHVRLDVQQRRLQTGHGGASRDESTATPE